MAVLSQSKRKFGVYVLCASLLSLGGCATRTPYGTERFSNFKPDCRIAEQQIVWLQSMKPTEAEKTKAKFRESFFKFPMFDDSYFENKKVAEGYIDWWVEVNIRQVYLECQK